jgi:FkbM family methyltransferase
MSADRNFFAPLRTLFGKGVRYSTVIDVGCADGHFFLALHGLGLVPGAEPLNLDANSLYEASLSSIKSVLGGHYRICAIADREGELEMTMSVHPYWSSLRPASDPYWQRVNDLRATTSKVQVTTLDALARQLVLRPPFLIKLDIQGAEASALRGGVDVLKNTHAVVCETDVADFEAVNTTLTERGFVLYDLTTICRVPDGTLCWFYPVFVNRALDFVRPRAVWDAVNNDAVIRMQDARRQAILKSNAEILDRIRSGASLRRNDACPCGSGLKYKQCCGALP